VGLEESWWVCTGRLAMAESRLPGAAEEARRATGEDPGRRQRLPDGVGAKRP